MASFGIGPRARSRCRPAGAASPRSGAPRRDRRRLASLSWTISARARDGRAWPSPSRPRSHRKVPAWRSGSCRASLPPAASGGRPVSGSAAGTPSIPRQLRTAGTGSSLPKAISRVSPRLKRSSGPCSDQIGVAGASGRRARLSALACSASAGRAWAAPGRRPYRGERGRAQSGHQLASIQREFGACHRTDADHFLVYLSSCDALPRCCQKGPFFCCGGVGSCYKPAARGIAAGYGCFSRGRGGTGRRAGFRFQ